MRKVPGKKQTRCRGQASKTKPTPPPPQLHATPLSFLSAALPLRIVAQRPKPFQDGHEYDPTTPPPPLLRLQGTDRQLDLDLSNGTRSRTPSNPDARLTTTCCSCGDER